MVGSFYDSDDLKKTDPPPPPPAQKKVIFIFRFFLFSLKKWRVSFRVVILGISSVWLPRKWMRKLKQYNLQVRHLGLFFLPPFLGRD